MPKKNLMILVVLPREDRVRNLIWGIKGLFLLISSWLQISQIVWSKRKPKGFKKKE